MSEEIVERRKDIERRCRIWLFGGYGLILAGMACLLFLPKSIQAAGWPLIIVGACGRVMHYLDLGNLRTLRRLEQEQSLNRLRQELPPKQ